MAPGATTLDAIYWAMVAAFLTHELDAVKRHEWRVLPLTSFLPERVGEQAFIWAHVPLSWLILWLDESTAMSGVRLGLSAFAVVHVWLHWILRRHPAYEFNNPSSWALIVLVGVLGALYLGLAATHG
jgi:hypothetical protein